MRTHRDRARELMLNEEHTEAFVELNDYFGDMDGNCPSCGEAVGRYESDRLTHARRCRDLQTDAMSDRSRR